MKDNSSDIFNTITEQAKNVVLSEKEKATLFRTVDAYVQKHPRVMAQSVVSPLSGSRWAQYFAGNHSSAMSFVVVVFVVLGAGTSFAAQGSLPGDLLYAVKVGVNEQVRAAFSSDIGKAVYEATRAVERLKEGQALEAQGKLTPELQTQIEARFEQHAAQVQKEAEVFTQTGQYSKALKVSEQFETVLKQEENVLQGAIAEKVKTTIETSAAVRVTTEDAVAASPVNTDEVRKVTEQKQVQVRTLINDLSQSVAARPADVSPSPAASSLIAPVPTSVKAIPVSSPTAPATAKKVNVSALTATATTTTKTDDALQSALTHAQALVRQGDELFGLGKYNEAFSVYRMAQDAAVQVHSLLQIAQ